MNSSCSLCTIVTGTVMAAKAPDEATINDRIGLIDLLRAIGVHVAAEEENTGDTLRRH